MYNGIVEAIITVCGTLLAVYIKDRLDKSAKDKKLHDLHEKSIEDLTKPILDLIQFELDANRVAYWEGINGTNTFSGFSIKKLSMVSESFSEDEHPTKDEMQNVSIDSFKRNMDSLRDSDEGYIISNEYQLDDNLSALHAKYNIKTLVAVKIYTKKKWTGILIIGFSKEDKLFTESEIEWIKLQAGRIGNIVTSEIKER